MKFRFVPSSTAQRRGLARLGILAVLLQALLFAWHSHPLPPSHAPTVAALAPNEPLSPTAADDDCAICLTLQHIGSSTPVEFVGLPTPRVMRVNTPQPDLAVAQGAFCGAFRARAPPAV